jgi:hypothetical protein
MTFLYTRVRGLDTEYFSFADGQLVHEMRHP